MVAINKQGEMMRISRSTSLIDRVFSWFVGKQVPDSIIQFHNKTYRDLSAKAWHVERIHRGKFDNEEFIKYLRIKRDLNQNKGDYKDLKKSVELLEVALNVKDSFLLIEETEMRFRSSIQQQYYKILVKVLSSSTNREKVTQLMRISLKKLFPQIKTPEGKKVMKDYFLAIETVSQHEFGLELLRSFKQSKLQLYTMLLNISNVAKTFKKMDLYDLRKLKIAVQENQEHFVQLGKVIDVPVQHRIPVSYARMLQYIALKHRHAKSTQEFDQLIKRLADWEKSFLTLVELRREYTTKDYRFPKEFTQRIPALETYEKYKEYVEDYHDQFR